MKNEKLKEYIQKCRFYIVEISDDPLYSGHLIAKPAIRTKEEAELELFEFFNKVTGDKYRQSTVEGIYKQFFNDKFCFNLEDSKYVVYDMETAEYLSNIK